MSSGGIQTLGLCKWLVTLPRQRSSGIPSESLLSPGDGDNPRQSPLRAPGIAYADVVRARSGIRIVTLT